ncbi:tyrosine-type recombinase/integrase [Bremerella sp. P1]|uniref:tyrosine-type recombinase/integrase n=1 Tax=Bremerella sp. P1 TaxID=3026424 RepID=UPI002368B005|nr:phage integrase SAM-like domain-containing protein [Bremerella sp. P1]WDI43970.1 phage integrase SAM-like domain-containing protein [Bremerella sp. P1]
MSAPKVKVVKVQGKYLVLRWQDPLTGQVRQRSAKTSDQAEATKAANKLESDLWAGRNVDRYKMTWKELRERYETEKLPSLAKKSQEGYKTSMNVFETRMRPHKLIDITSIRLSEFQTRMRRDKLSERTIASYLRHLKAIFNWAVSMGIMDETPRIQMPKRAKGSKVMKGRPISDAEFQDMLEAVDEVVKPEHVESWKHYLEGMWWSGLRLSESLLLSWESHGALSIDLTGTWPLLRIDAEFEKGNQDRVCALAPEFVEVLLKTPKRQRKGFVFDPLGYLCERPRVDWVSKMISEFGRTAGIVVNVDRRTGKKKFASIHDFRRSFGERWSKRLLPQQLRELMRHESIETTLKFYVGIDAQRTAELLWNVVEAERLSIPTEQS